MALLITFQLLHFSAAAQQPVFRDVPEATLRQAGQKRLIVPDKIRSLQLDTAALSAFLRQLPGEQQREMAPEMILPMPDGSNQRFRIWESSAMAPELAAAYPAIRSYTGQGVDDPTATIKIDWNEYGFQAMILSPVSGTVMIDPYAERSMTACMSYYKADYKKKDWLRELPPVKSKVKANGGSVLPDNVQASQCVGTQLRTYRLAVACTGEYAVAATGLASPTRAQILAKVVTSVNRVNGVYEKELSIRLVLIPNDTLVLFGNPSTDPFTANDDGPTLLGQSQTQIDSRIGSANYDIGHTFSTGAGGIAQLGCVCLAGNKARGVTGSPVPVGDAYDIDFVAHEMGHQFGADHAFNNGSACGSTSSDQNAEPGSGSTIMCYAGVCDSDNLQNNSDPQFHAVSFDAISTFAINGGGNSCAVKTNTGNTPPVVNAGADYVIPKSTPFILTGTATDANDAANALTYSWEQVDVGGPNGASTAPSGNAPLFRSFQPVTTGTRFFPRLSNVINNTTTIGERLPSYGRNMKFRLTVRDNRAGGGGVCFDENQLTVDGNSGPFLLTFPSASGIIWNVNEFRTITWDPAGTSGAPVNCANVMIQLSTDGGNTFPNTLLNSTPNDGSEEIQVPANLTTNARIRVMAVGNVFYDMSNSNFRIQNSPTATFVFNSPVPVLICSGNSASTTLKTGALGGFATSINLTASLNPPGTTVSFGSTSLAPGNSTTVTLNNVSGLAPGTYTVRVTGIAGAVTQTRDIQFVVAATATPPSSLTLPANAATGVGVLPSFNWSVVAGSTSYTLEIATNSNFSPVLQTISGITALPYTLISSLSENTIYYWRVRTLGGCGALSAPGSANVFKTGLNSCKTSADVPKTISSVGTPTVNSVITIPADAAVTITDVNVINLQGTHSWVGDLTFRLRGPNNVTVTLAGTVCDGGWENFDMNFDDQAASTAFACPPTGGQTVRPINALSAFNGISSAGTWTLSITDGANQDGGSLSNWGLNFNASTTTGCIFTATPLATVYTFTGNGNWNVASNWASNTVPPNPLPAGQSIIIDHADGGNCILNVSQTISAGASLTVQTGRNLLIPGNLTIQ